MGGRLHGDREFPEEQRELARGIVTAEGRGWGRRIVRFALSCLVTALVLLAWDAWVIDESPDRTLLTAAAVVLANSFVWPVISRFTIILSAWTLGLAGLALNVLLVSVAVGLTPGLSERASFTDTLWLVSGLTVVNLVLAGIFGVEDDAASRHRHAVRLLRRRGEREETDVPGVLFLEIDGLSIEVLRRALRDGYAPTLARWLRSGTHRLAPWECDLSSQTSASQAGLLLGCNENIPAFRWYERATGRVVTSSSPKDVAAIERRQSTGTGLLSGAGGASRVNLFSGDAERRMFTLSAAGVASRSGARDYLVYFLQPFAVIRTALLAIADILLERWQAADQYRRRVWPRIDRRGTYPLIRAFTTVIQRDIAIAALEQDMLRGTPRAYATFVAYDEVAHHSGVERSDALGVLRRLDAAFARLERVQPLAARPYEFVVLSDHGQSQGATFHQRFGETLAEFVERCTGDAVATESADDREETALVAATVGDVRRTREVPEPERATKPEAALQVMVSGSLAHLYDTSRAQRATRSDLEGRTPGLIRNLAAHEGIGAVVVRGDDQVPVVITAEGEAPLGSEVATALLAAYGPNATRHLRRADGFRDCGDLMILGAYDPLTDEVTAFEQLCGSHGGLGGGQSHPFVLFPSAWRMPQDEVIGAEAMHRVLKGWLRDVGQELPDDAPAASAAARAQEPLDA